MTATAVKPAETHAEALDDLEEPLPKVVEDAAPGELNVTRDEFSAPSMPQHDVWIGQDHVGVIFDESAANLARGAFGAWSSKCRNRGGVVGFYATKEEAAQAIADLYAPAEESTETPAPPAPQWRTLKGITGPFFIWMESDDRFASDRKQCTGAPVKFTRWWMEGTRVGETEDGRKIRLWGVATKYWVAA
ncbi:hypothetical protein ABZ468_07685 [Streptomyces sp. NPDC005708]|uniref:hypothetical protein n=1 Tax=Streptomyces sp. NPDC005708 TaxID=3154564 RepID=UPI0033E03E47